jgi:hypothetical protein
MPNLAREESVSSEDLHQDSGFRSLGRGAVAVSPRLKPGLEPNGFGRVPVGEPYAASCALG